MRLDLKRLRESSAGYLEGLRGGNIGLVGSVDELDGELVAFGDGSCIGAFCRRRYELWHAADRGAAAVLGRGCAAFACGEGVAGSCFGDGAAAAAGAGESAMEIGVNP